MSAKEITNSVKIVVICVLYASLIEKEKKRTTEKDSITCEITILMKTIEGSRISDIDW